MEVKPDELFAQIGHLTIENKVLYNLIADLEAKIQQLESPDTDKDVPDTPKEIEIPVVNEDEPHAEM